MSQRMNYFAAAPEGLQAMINLEKYIASCSNKRDTLEGSLVTLIKLRVSQINGCAYCIDMHSKDARAEGETEQRLYTLSAWRETSFYSEKECAALAWAEANTLIAGNSIDDELYSHAREHFSEPALVDLTLTIAAINSWNRIALSFRPEAGSYEVGSINF
ncbi:MAG: carboxymuconolactone decarboxylase family protein [Amphritea sp.]